MSISPRVHPDHLAPPARRRLARATGVLGLAIALGVYADEGHRLPALWGLIPQLGAPWVGLSFLAGRQARRAFTGAVAGVGAVAVGLLSYHFFKIVAYGPNAVGVFATSWRLWAVVGIVLGSVSGEAGRVTRVGPQTWLPYAWGTFGGLVLAEATAIFLGLQGTPVALAAAELVVAGTILVWAVRMYSPSRVAAAVCVAVALGVAGAFLAPRVLDVLLHRL